MDKHSLIRKVAVIHAIKCNYSAHYNEAIQSNNRLSELSKEIYEANDSDLLVINSSIDRWSTQSPIASETEIARLLNNRT